MGAHKNINAAKFPSQGELAGRHVLATECQYSYEPEAKRCAKL